jgi:uracil-DNA glycosylase family 4
MPDLFYGTSGPRDARIAFVAEAWGVAEEAAKAPLVGQSGELFTGILSDAGINRTDCFLTNVVSLRPEENRMWSLFEPFRTPTLAPVGGLHPTQFVRDELDRLYEQLRTVQPDLVVACGNYALWALTSYASAIGGKDNRTGKAVGRKVPGGIGRYRGSQLFQIEDRLNPASGYSSTKLLPIIHPAAILRQWNQRWLTVHDLSARVPLALADDWAAPPYELLAPPSFEQAVEYLETLLAKLGQAPTAVAIDVETYEASFITCIGFCYEALRAMSLPLVNIAKDRRKSHLEPYWDFREEFVLFRLTQRVLSHPNARIEGQNFLYDTQHIQVSYCYTPRCDFDTMLAHHLLLPGTKKSLDALSSLYCHNHVYWKDDNRDWDLKTDIRDHLRYNAIDCVRTHEVATALRALVAKSSVAHLWQEVKDTQTVCLEMMNRGMREDVLALRDLTIESMEQQSYLTSWLLRAIPQACVGVNEKGPWYNSAQQTMRLLYDMMGLPPVLHRKTKQRTGGKEALKELRAAYPGLRPLFDHMLALRSLQVIHRTFMKAKLDVETINHTPVYFLRCSYDPSGTSTFRLNSRKNAFDRGTNMQNMPKGKLTDYDIDFEEDEEDEDEPIDIETAI